MTLCTPTVTTPTLTPPGVFAEALLLALAAALLAGLLPVALVGFWTPAYLRAKSETVRALPPGGSPRIAGGDTLIVASSDMSHFESAGETDRKDKLAIARVCALDPDGLLEVVAVAEMCLLAVHVQQGHEGLVVEHRDHGKL